VYQLGSGSPLLLLPAPHGFVAGPTAEGPLARLLAALDRMVITFDPPGAFRSTRPAHVDLAEMLGCAAEALAACGVDGPVDVVGHSMSGLCTLAFAVEHPEAVRRLLLTCTPMASGWQFNYVFTAPAMWNTGCRDTSASNATNGESSRASK
jgi:pimeloyl-ACP methyl ester carboxylesterase